MKGLILLVAVALVIFTAAFRMRRRRNDETFVDFYQAESEGFKINGRIKTMELKEGKKATVGVIMKTKHGHAAGYQSGTARFTSSDESIVSVETSKTNELEAVIRGLDGSANETVTIEFRADADQGEGVREVVAVLPVTCTQGDALVVAMSAGVPTDDDTEAETPGFGGTLPADNAADGDTDGSEGDTPATANDAAGTIEPATGGDQNGFDGKGGAEPAADKTDEGVPASEPADLAGAKDENSDPNSGNAPAEPENLDGSATGLDSSAADHVSDVPPGDDAGPMTFAEAAADTKERNSDTSTDAADSKAGE